MAQYRMLLVDDEAYITTLMAQKLQKQGIAVQTARNGQEGLRLALASPVDLIVSDYQMPFMDGVAMATALKAEPATSQLPLILLSGRGHRITPTQLAATNIQAVLEKPFSAKDLIARIMDLLQRGRPEHGQKGAA